MTIMDNDRWIKLAICPCCLIITANGDHSGCEGNCTNADCDENCDHGCSATFGYSRPENAWYHLTASYADCVEACREGCDHGEGYFSWSPCGWCEQEAGQRVDVWAEIIEGKDHG